MFNIGLPEMILILVVGLIIFGPKKLPEIGKAVGLGMREFKKAVNDIRKSVDIEGEIKTAVNLDSRPVITTDPTTEIPKQHSSNAESSEKPGAKEEESPVQ